MWERKENICYCNPTLFWAYQAPPRAWGTDCQGWQAAALRMTRRQAAGREQPCPGREEERHLLQHRWDPTDSSTPGALRTNRMKSVCFAKLPPMLRLRLPQILFFTTNKSRRGMAFSLNVLDPFLNQLHAFWGLWSVRGFSAENTTNKTLYRVWLHNQTWKIQINIYSIALQWLINKEKKINL